MTLNSYGTSRSPYSRLKPSQTCFYGYGSYTNINQRKNYLPNHSLLKCGQICIKLGTKHFIYQTLAAFM